MTTVVNVHEAKSTLSRLLELVAAGEHVVIARAGRPVADLVPHRRIDVVYGTATGAIRYDPRTFDEPDDAVIDAFEGR